MQQYIRRLYAGYEGSTTATTAAANTFQSFREPASGVQVYRQSIDNGVPDVSVESDGSGGIQFRFSENVRPNSWFDITSTCNAKKAAGGAAERRVQVVWYLNGAPAGPIRYFDMTNVESSIVTGNGQLPINPNDIITPMVASETNDKVVFTTCQFNIKEDPEYS